MSRDDHEYCKVCGLYLFTDVPDGDECVMGDCSYKCMFCIPCYLKMNEYKSESDISEKEWQGKLNICFCTSKKDNEIYYVCKINNKVVSIVTDPIYAPTNSDITKYEVVTYDDRQGLGEMFKSE